MKKFKEVRLRNNMERHLIMPHGSYLINLGSPEDEKLEKSRQAFVDELSRCEQVRDFSEKIQ